MYFLALSICFHYQVTWFVTAFSDASQSLGQFEQMSVVHLLEEERMNILEIIRSYFILLDIHKQNLGRALDVKHAINT